ncbi:aromatic amino acid lyase [Pseudomonas sp. 148P]|uniref:Aromatic amino acid lyase n=1 Tax=Pseudomonas ulcerans TaxID=3115852 RepID=A0ABU7HV47_9PSED|nr:MULTISPECIES: aromatic amino acid lyase [unclassified Pseudomonas]MEE1923513.1 aromatic amino acid lyase [Pseudomonas sp. 147P]MEE1935420.1 aromatic amino acid lyase [Pseudomonas sp. 148P]
MSSIELGPDGFGLERLLAVVDDAAPLRFGRAAQEAIAGGHRLLLDLVAAGAPIYGVTTGLGAAVEQELDDPAFQQRIAAGRAVGIGRLASRREVRAILCARLAGLAQGRSGISPGSAEALLALLDHGIHPEVPLLGSLGQSDLAPLAHVTLAVQGQGWVEYRGERLAAAEALRRAGLQPRVLRNKDGLALVSANSASIGLGALLIAEVERLLERQLAVLALSCEGYRAGLAPFQPWAARLRPVPGQAEASADLLVLLAGSDLLDPQQARRLQDPLSFRCATVVLGAARQAWRQAREVLEIELGSGADNPALIAESRQVLVTANFDSTHLALAFEGLGLALSRLAVASAERMAKLLSPASSELPRGLTMRPGRVGLLALQRTAAALVAEIVHLANPLPALSVPVADRIEDYAGQALAVVEKTATLVQRLEWLVRIEAVIAAQAVDLRGGLRLGQGAVGVYRQVRRRVGFVDEDRGIDVSGDFWEQ